MLNEEGKGFQYGRSLDPFGVSAFWEILSTAAVLGILTESEIEMEFATFSLNPTSDGNKISFKDGEVASFTANGYQQVLNIPINKKPDYGAPTGAMKNLIQ